MFHGVRACGVSCPLYVRECVGMCVCVCVYVVRVWLPISHMFLDTLLFLFSSQMIKLLSIYHVSNLDA